jgi:hypothetical protein
MKKITLMNDLKNGSTIHEKLFWTVLNKKTKL